MTTYNFEYINNTFNSHLKLEVSDEVDEKIYSSVSELKKYLLRVSYVDSSDTFNLYYDINSMYSLTHLLENKLFDGEYLKKLLTGMFHLQRAFIENCIPITSIVLNPEYIYYSLVDECFYFVFLPFHIENAKDNTFELIQVIGDYFDANLLVTPVFFHEYLIYVSGGNYSLKGIHNIFFKSSGLVDDLENSFESNEDNLLSAGETSFNIQSFEEDIEGKEIGIKDFYQEENSSKESELLDEVFVNKEKEDELSVNNYSVKKVLFLSILFEVFSISLFVIVFLKYINRFENKLYALLGMGLVFIIVNVSVLKKVFLKDVVFTKGKFTRNLLKRKAEENAEDDEFMVDINAINKLEEDRTIALSTGEDHNLVLVRKDTGDEFLINQKNSMVGRSKSDVDVYIENETVGRKHAVISKREGSYYLKDLGSLNGTFLNKKRLKKDRSVCLSNGDVIKFSNVKMRVRI